jgi:hypothetical protein
MVKVSEVRLFKKLICTILWQGESTIMSTNLKLLQSFQCIHPKSICTCIQDFIKGVEEHQLTGGGAFVMGGGASGHRRGRGVTGCGRTSHVIGLLPRSSKRVCASYSSLFAGEATCRGGAGGVEVKAARSVNSVKRLDKYGLLVNTVSIHRLIRCCIKIRVGIGNNHKIQFGFGAKLTKVDANF